MKSPRVIKPVFVHMLSESAFWCVALVQYAVHINIILLSQIFDLISHYLYTDTHIHVCQTELLWLSPLYRRISGGLQDSVTCSKSHCCWEQGTTRIHLCCWWECKTVHLENSLAVFSKVKCILFIWPSKPTSRNLPKRN